MRCQSNLCLNVIQNAASFAIQLRVNWRCMQVHFRQSPGIQKMLWWGFVCLISAVSGFRITSSIRSCRSECRMAWKARETEEQYLIAPSILSADFARLGEEVTNVLAAGADVVHFDVMDNHYVPNLTIGPMVCKALRDHGVTKDIDVHLMVQPVDALIQEFAKAGASYITFHPEASNHVHRSLSLTRQLGCKSGLVLNPSTSLEHVRHVLDQVDIILIMSVNPGFGGQSFIPSALEKLRAARKMITESGRDIRLEIDGGVNASDIQDIARAGADIFVAGSALLKAPRTKEAYAGTIQDMRRQIGGATA